MAGDAWRHGRLWVMLGPMGAAMRDCHTTSAPPRPGPAARASTKPVRVCKPAWRALPSDTLLAGESGDGGPAPRSNPSGRPAPTPAASTHSSAHCTRGEPAARTRKGQKKKSPRGCAPSRHTRRVLPVPKRAPPLRRRWVREQTRVRPRAFAPVHPGQRGRPAPRARGGAREAGLRAGQPAQALLQGVGAEPEPELRPGGHRPGLDEPQGG
jgi:hypothetical protein